MWHHLVEACNFYYKFSLVQLRTFYLRSFTIWTDGTPDHYGWRKLNCFKNVPGSICLIHWLSYIWARFWKGFQLAFVGKYLFTEISNLPIHSFLAPISSLRFIWLWKLWFALRYSAKKIIASQNPFNRRERYGVWKMGCRLNFWSGIKWVSFTFDYYFSLFSTA